MSNSALVTKTGRRAAPVAMALLLPILLLSAVCAVAFAGVGSRSETPIPAGPHSTALPHKRHVRLPTVQPRPFLDSASTPGLPSGSYPTDGDAFMIDTSIVGTGVGVWAIGTYTPRA